MLSVASAEKQYLFVSNVSEFEVRLYVKCADKFAAAFVLKNIFLTL